MGARGRRNAVRAFVLGACVASVLGMAQPSSAAVDRAFAERFSADVPGDVAIIGNTNVTCTDGSSACLSARTAPASNTAVNTTIINDSLPGITGIFGGDADAAVARNSSKATLTLPAGSEVLYAGLYWSASLAPIDGGTPAPNPANAINVLFKPPGAASYSQLTSTQTDTLSHSDFTSYYQAFKDVTNQVKAAGSGSYSVANIESSTAQEAYAGWSLVVAYRNPADPARSLTVWDGFRGVRPDANVAIPVSGFKTPLTGAVKTSVGFVAWEGDRGLTGDGASITDTTAGHSGSPQTLSNATNPATNVFNGSITRNGVELTNRTPNDTNTFSIDADVLDASGTLGNNATSASINLSSTSERYAAGVVSFATELYAPDITQTNTVTDDNGNVVEPGDTLTYDISGTNAGGDAATSLSIADQIPANTTYVPGSAAVVSGPGGSSAAYDANANRATFTLGTLAPAGSYHVRLKVKVSRAAANGTNIPDTAVASFSGATLGVADSVSSTANATVAVIPADLSLTKTSDLEIVEPGDVITYTIAVHNAGPGTARNTRVIDTLPEGTTLADGPVSCTSAGRVVTCPLGDLVSGADVTLVLKALVGPGVTGNLINIATVESDTPDGNDANNSNDPSSAKTTVKDPVVSPGPSGDGSPPPGPTGPASPSGPLTPAGPALPPPSTPSAPDCKDKARPVTTLVRKNVRGTGTVRLSAEGGLTLSGTSVDPAPCASGLKRVQVSLARVAGRTGVNCRFLKRPDKYQLTPAQNCRKPVLFNARGTTSWSFTFPVKLKPGKYRAQARGVDMKNNKETPKKGRSIVYFTVR